jgi:hypothetical protein
MRNQLHLLQQLLKLDLRVLLILFRQEKKYDILLNHLHLHLHYIDHYLHHLRQQQLNNLLDLDQILVMCKFLMM